MGTGKKESTRRSRQGKNSDGMANVRTKGENFYRDAKKVKVLSRLKDGKPTRNASGKIVQAASFQSRDVPTAVVQPDRRWFGNTRVISQSSLTAFRDAMAEQAANPYQVLLKSNKLPMSLIRDGQNVNGIKTHQAKMTVEGAPFSQTFGPKSQRKRPKLSVGTMEDLADDSSRQLDTYTDKLDQAMLLSEQTGEAVPVPGLAGAEVDTAAEPVFKKGQSARIWKELYKVIDSSDVLISVLDARDPYVSYLFGVAKPH
jgi:nuclear GTP-binding protein